MRYALCDLLSAGPTFLGTTPKLDFRIIQLSQQRFASQRFSLISLSEKPIALSLFLRNLFASSLALRARPISAIVSNEVTKQPGF